MSAKEWPSGEAGRVSVLPGRDECPHLDIAFSTRAGAPGRLNEDYVGVMPGEEAQRPVRGSAIVLADGMGGSGGGRVAAELVVRSFVDAYYGLPDTLLPDVAAGRALDAIHRWLYQTGRNDPQLNLLAACVAVLIVRGAEAWLISAGDVQLNLLRDGTLTRIGRDDSVPVLLGAYVGHAVGLHEALVTHTERFDLQPGDRLLLCTDGVHRRIPVRELLAVLAADARPEGVAERLIEVARTRGSTDDASAVVVDVKRLPSLDFGYLERVVGALPIPAVPRVGDVIDGYVLTSLLSDGHDSRVLVGHDKASPSTPLVLKFPRPRAGQDANVRLSLAREHWLAGRVDEPGVLAPIPVPPGRQTRLYVVMPYYPGVTLETLLTRERVSLRRGLEIACQLGRAIHALNRRRIVHRDIKPDNVLVTDDGRVLLLDLGFALIPGVLAPAPDDAPGTPAFMAPELMRGERGDARSDVFAFGVTLYRLFSGGAMPYGFSGRVPLYRHRPDLPEWLDVVLEKALQSEPGRRYQDVHEVCADLQRFADNRDTARTSRRRPLAERHPVTFWQAVSAVLLAVLLIVLSFSLRR